MEPEDVLSGMDLPVEMQGVRVLFDGVPAPLVYRTPQAIEVMVPWELAGQSSTSEYAGSAGAPVAGDVAGGGLDAFSDQPLGGFLLSWRKPEDFRSRSRTGVYATGTGPMSPAGITGSLNPPAASVALPVSVTIGGKPAPVVYAGSSTDPFFGLFTKFAVGIPPDAPQGDNIPVVLTVGGVSSGRAPVSRFSRRTGPGTSAPVETAVTRTGNMPLISAGPAFYESFRYRLMRAASTVVGWVDRLR